ncbi:hypothetical protein ABZX95_09855 [Streptomyces sp. NPDC004232]|uniref:hypothetical protein n=1 Tax=Streptomyces sp. NPDC004232 TaxID=3154454 RepID=UPI0033B48E89
MTARQSNWRAVPACYQRWRQSRDITRLFGCGDRHDAITVALADSNGEGKADIALYHH